jgi:hypothetical protein
VSEVHQTGLEPGFDEANVEAFANATRVEDFISTSHMVPSTDWILANVCSKGKGYRVQLARLYGSARRTEDKENMVKGQKIQSIMLEGAFEMVIFETGEVIKAPVAYLPPKWGRQVKSYLQACGNDPGARCKMVLTLGCVATGGGVPYSWTVTTHIEESDPELAELKASVQMRVAGPGVQRQIEGTAEAAE